MYGMAFPLDVTPRADGVTFFNNGLLVQRFLCLVDHIMPDGAYKMSRTAEGRGDWSRVYLSRINYVHVENN